MAGVTGLEPAASCVTGMRYNQLNYHPSGHGRDRTDDIQLAKLALSQLSYTP